MQLDVTVNINLDSDQIASVLIAELTNQRTQFVADYNKVKENKKGFIFDIDPKEDQKQIMKMIKSINIILEWYKHYD